MIHGRINHVASVVVIWSLGIVVPIILDLAKQVVKDTTEEATQFRQPLLFEKENGASLRVHRG
jgi:hypothetical protein